MWDWGGPATFAHDELSTDKRNPTANANGPIYGVDWGNDGFLTLDPQEHTATEVRIPVLDPKTPPGKPQSMPVPSPYWGSKLYWFDPGDHEPRGDGQQGPRLDVVAVPPARGPAGVLHEPSVRGARAAAERASGRSSTSIRSTKQFKQVDICFDTHHVQFATDADETLYGNGVFSGAIGWVNTRMLDETGDAGAAQGWCLP